MNSCVRKRGRDYQTTGVRTVVQLETVAYADVGRVGGTHLRVDVLHGRVGIALIIRCGLGERKGRKGTMMSCWFMRLPTTISL